MIPLMEIGTNQTKTPGGVMDSFGRFVMGEVSGGGRNRMDKYPILYAAAMKWLVPQPGRRREMTAFQPPERR